MSGYKVFTAGEEALATQVNDLLMSQSVARFTTAATRTAGIASPVTNQLTMLDSAPGLIDAWNGSAWVNINPPGPMERYVEAAPGVIAGGPNGVNAYEFPSFVVQRTGIIIFEGMARVSSPGAQAISVDFTAAAVGPAPANSQVSTTQDVTAGFQDTVPILGRWAPATKGTTMAIKVRIGAGNAPSAVTLVGVWGMIRHVAEF